MRGCPRWPLIEGPGVERPHGASRAWSPGAWSDWAEGTLNLLLNELLGVVNLLGRAPDDEEFEVRVPVGWQLSGDLYKGASLLVYGFHVLATSADDQPALVSGDGEGHLPTGGPPIALAPASTSASGGHARTPWRAWGTAPEALEEIIDDPCGVLTPVWGPHYVSYLLRTRPVILFKLYSYTGVILDLLDHLSASTNDHTHRMPGHWHIDTPTDPGSILVPVPKASLVTLPKDVHHHLAGLLHFVRISDDPEWFVHICVLGTILD